MLWQAAGRLWRGGHGQTVVLEDVGFALPERGSLAVLDRNGVGKTTLLATLQRLIREESLTVLLVEQHAMLALQVTQSALVLSRGRIVHQGPSADLLRDPDRLAALVVAQ